MPSLIFTWICPAIALMKEISLETLPPCFEKWCAKFDNLFQYKAQKNGFRYYLAGLLGESKRKNIPAVNIPLIN